MQITDVRIRKVEKEGKMKDIVMKIFYAVRALPGVLWTIYLVKTNNQGFIWTVYRDAEQKSRRRRFPGYRTSDQFRDKGSDSGIDTEKV